MALPHPFKCALSLSDMQGFEPALRENDDACRGIEGRQSVKFRMTMLLEHLKRVYAESAEPVIIVSHHDALFEILGMSLKNAEYVVTDLLQS